MEPSGDMLEREELPDAFRLKGVMAWNGSVVTGDNPVSIATVPAQWAYAAIFPFRQDPEIPPAGDRRMIVQIEATVESGRIGVALARPDLRHFICREEQASGPATKTLELFVDTPRPGISLVVRNTAAGGVVSNVHIHSIRAWLLSEPEGAAADPGFVPLEQLAPTRGNDVDVFDTLDARAINRARLDHLSGLGLSLQGKSVLDVGCGVGHLSGFFVERGCDVTCVDARPENLARLVSLYPGRKTHVANVEVDPFVTFGQFDVVFCYGLLYHSENPIAALRNMASCCRELLLLETVVTDHPGPIFQLADEPHPPGTRPCQASAAVPVRPFSQPR